MKIRLLISLLTLALTSQGFSQIVADYIAGGRALLTVSNIPTANAFFGVAVSTEPNNQEANMLLAITRLLALPSQQGGGALLDQLGVPAPGRSIHNWTAVPTNDANGIPIAPENTGTAEVFSFIRTGFLPELNNSLLNLSRITDPNFSLHLNANETKVSDVTLDYGDVLMLRSLIHALRFATLTMTAHNCEAQLTTVKALYTGDMTAEFFLATHPEFLNFSNLEDLYEARTAYQEAVDTYLLASDFIKNRPLGQVRLFNVDIAGTDDEQTFRDALTSVKASLDGAAVLVTDTNYIVNMGAYYTGAQSIRSFLPTYRGNSFILGTLKDLTFGQTILGLPQKDVENAFARYFKAIPNITAVGLNQNVFHFQMHVLEDVEYVVQMSSDLQTWIDTEFVKVPGGVMIIQDDANQQFRFYRILDLSSYISIEGRVINASTGLPVSGTRVSTSLENTSVYTDEQGQFFLRTRTPAEIENEYFAIQIAAPGFWPFETSRWWGSNAKGLVFYVSELPVNDFFVDRKLLTTSDSGITIGATREPGEPQHYGFSSGKSIWWSWKCPQSGTAIIDTIGSDFDTTLSIYTGNAVSALSLISSNDDGGGIGLTSRVYFNAVAGQTYQIAVDGYAGDSGNVRLKVTR